MDKLFVLLKDLLPLEIAALIVIFIYFLKLFKDLAADFNKVAQQQAEYMRQRVETVDKTTAIFERTVAHQEKDLQRLYDVNEKLKGELETKEEEGIKRLDTQLRDIVEGIEQVRQETISKDELERLESELSAAKRETTARYSSLIKSLSAEKTHEGEEEISLRKAFVVVPYTATASHRYDLIKKTAIEAGLKVFRADETATPGVDIASHVKRCIEEADIILVDITGRNPSVMYELGYTHALAKPVILLASDRSEIPFDTSNYRIVVFDETPRGIEILRQRLTDAIHELTRESVSKKWSNWLQAVSEAIPYADIARVALKLMR